MDRSEKIRVAVEQFRAQVDAFRDGDAYRSFLDAVATFHTYSPRNACLIVHQCPRATYVKGFKSWLDLGRAVRKGEKGLTILAPRPFSKTVRTKKGEEAQAGISFAAVAVFDVSQTDPLPGHPSPFVPPAPTTLDDEAGGHHLAALVAHLEAQGVRFATEDPMLRDGANGFYRHGDRTVCVRPAPALQMLKTAVHEAAHAFAHGLPHLGKEDGEVVAESVAYVVLRHLGLASDGYSVPYVAGWLAEDRRSFERGLGHIQTLATRIITALDGSDSDSPVQGAPYAAPPSPLPRQDGAHTPDDPEPPASAPAPDNASASESADETRSYQVTITQDGRTLDRFTVHGCKRLAYQRAKCHRARVADRDGINLDQIAATVAAITPPVRSMSDPAIALDPRSLPATDAAAGEDRAACLGDGFTACREDDDGTVWPTNTCQTCEGSGTASTDDAGDLDPQAEAILADRRSAPAFRPYVHLMPR